MSTVEVLSEKPSLMFKVFQRANPSTDYTSIARMLGKAQDFAI
jgi:hypothetical protein